MAGSYCTFGNKAVNLGGDNTCEVGMEITLTQTKNRLCEMCMSTRDAAFLCIYDTKFSYVVFDQRRIPWEHFEFAYAAYANRIIDLLKDELQHVCVCSVCLAERFQIAAGQ